jgi:hypothetical protein
MNCSACGTHLLQEAANCPQCGAPTPYAYAHANIEPNAPTVVSSLYTDPTDAQQPPPTMYGSPSYPNPYDDIPLAPPPPSPKRPANRVGLIVGVLLVLLLIGGGGFAWLAYSSANNTPPHATPSATGAAQHFTAKGTSTIVSDTTTSSHQDGQNTINSITEQVVSYGDIAGSFTNQETSIIHSDHTTSFSGSSTCICTVHGKSGTLMWSFSGTSAVNGSFQGQFFDIHGTGDLAKLHGQGVFQGQGLHDTYSSELYFDA